MQRSSAIVLFGLLLLGAGGAALLSLLGGGEPDPQAPLSPLDERVASESAAQVDAPPPRPRERVEEVEAPTTESSGREQASGGPRRLHDGTLHGEVVVPMNGGSEPAAGVRALLVAGHTEPSLGEVAQLLAQARPEHLQVTDAQGRFTFVGLERGAPYALLLGGAGLIGSQRFWPVQAGQGAREFRMHHLYGALLHLRDQSGAPPHVNRGLVGQRAGKALSTKPGVFPLFGTTSAALLSGVQLEQLDPDRVADRLMLFTSQIETEQVGPFQFRASFPGYEPVDQPFEARRVALGFNEYEIEVVANADGFGELEIAVIGWRGPCPAFVASGNATAYLRLNSSIGEVVHFEVRDFSGDELRVDGIPWGEYEATFGTSPHLRSTIRGGGQAKAVRIGAVPARLVIDLSDRGSLVLKLTDSEGTTHVGRVALLLSTGDRQARGWRTHHFTGPPYRIDDLEPGTWNLYLQIPFDAGTSAELPLPVRVAGGTCTEVELSE